MIHEIASQVFPNMQYGLAVAAILVTLLIILMSVVSLIVFIYLSISYIRYNRKKNSVGLTGEQIARRVLDKNGLNNIKVSATGSVMFGNSYSHYFKKVRLRRLTYKKSSVASMAMAVQKSTLAVLDKENDPDMRRRVKLIPIISFGPLAFIPLVVIGALIDKFLLNGGGVCTVVGCALGLVFYLYSFILSLMVLKTEKKAQTRALEIMQKDNIANSEEREMAQKLFKLYNIEYVNDMVLSMLELIYYILQIVSMVQGGEMNLGSNN